MLPFLAALDAVLGGYVTDGAQPFVAVLKRLLLSQADPHLSSNLRAHSSPCIFIGARPKACLEPSRRRPAFLRDKLSPASRDLAAKMSGHRVPRAAGPYWATSRSVELITALLPILFYLCLSRFFKLLLKPPFSPPPRHRSPRSSIRNIAQWVVARLPVWSN